jgi:hypothetical protein
MKSDIIIQLHKNFEDYAQQIDGEEFWLARDLQGLLGYACVSSKLFLTSNSTGTRRAGLTTT